MSDRLTVHHTRTPVSKSGLRKGDRTFLRDVAIGLAVVRQHRRRAARLVERGYLMPHDGGYMLTMKALEVTGLADPLAPFGKSRRGE